MKILVVSDSHGMYVPLDHLLKHFQGKVDAVIHCGDSELEGDDVIWDNVDVAVAGNMDFDRSFAIEETLQVGQLRVFVTHGHLFQVNAHLDRLAETAKSYACQIACYGHTHRLGAERVNGVVCINPGSIRSPRGPVTEPTYAILTYEAPRLQVDWYREDHHHLPQLTQQFELGETT